ncbi:hypothetical protein ACET3Z_015243 [Daucus carota]
MVEIHEEIDVQSPTEDITDDGDEEISYNDLKNRMRKDRIRMQKLKAKREEPESSEARLEQLRRKKMSRSQDAVLKYMVKIMEVCNAQGFVYGIVTEKGKPVTGSSDSLRSWWKESEGQGGALDRSMLHNYQKRKYKFDSERSVDKLYAYQHSARPHSELPLGFSNKNLQADHQSSYGHHHIFEVPKAPGSYATYTATTEHPLINIEVAQHEGRMKKRNVTNDGEWMEMDIDMDEEHLDAQEKQANLNLVEKYGQYWEEDVVEQVWFEELYGTRREKVDLNTALTKEVWNETGTTSIWDLGYQSPKED